MSEAVDVRCVRSLASVLLSGGTYKHGESTDPAANQTTSASRIAEALVASQSVLFFDQDSLFMLLYLLHVHAVFLDTENVAEVPLFESRLQLDNLMVEFVHKIETDVVHRARGTVLARLPYAWFSPSEDDLMFSLLLRCALEGSITQRHYRHSDSARAFGEDSENDSDNDKAKQVFA